MDPRLGFLRGVFAHPLHEALGEFVGVSAGSFTVLDPALIRHARDRHAGSFGTLTSPIARAMRLPAATADEKCR